MLRLYLKPEQPPGSTLTRRPASAGLSCSVSMNLSTSSTALGVKTIWMPVLCSPTLLMPLLLALPSLRGDENSHLCKLGGRAGRVNGAGPGAAPRFRAGSPPGPPLRCGAAPLADCCGSDAPGW